MSSFTKLRNLIRKGSARIAAAPGRDQLRGLVVLGVMVLTPACALDDGVDDIDTGTTTFALCTDSGVPNYSSYLHLGDVGGSVLATSPTTTYGSSLCIGRFVVEATSTAGKPNLQAHAEWENPVLSQATCHSGSASMFVYGFDGASWVQLGGEHTGTGVWYLSPFGSGGYCSVSADIGVPATYQKVRVAAKATRQTIFGAIPQRVTGVIDAHW